jgi:hypothetical protein
MDAPTSKLARCAVYTRKSTEYNLDLAFNSLDAQREACEAYIQSQSHEGWRAIPGRYDDGAFSGASLERPALQHRNGTIEIDSLGQLSRAELRVLWEREFAGKAPPRSDVTFWRLALPSAAGTDLWRAHQASGQGA